MPTAVVVHKHTTVVHLHTDSKQVHITVVHMHTIVVHGHTFSRACACTLQWCISQQCRHISQECSCIYSSVPNYKSQLIHAQPISSKFYGQLSAKLILKILVLSRIQCDKNYQPNNKTAKRYLWPFNLGAQPGAEKLQADQSNCKIFSLISDWLLGNVINVFLFRTHLFKTREISCGGKAAKAQIPKPGYWYQYSLICFRRKPNGLV